MSLYNTVETTSGMIGSTPDGWSLLLAQLAQPGIDTPEEAALIFSGPQFFIALLSGIVLAFGFQMLLTNLAVATGASYLVHRPSSSSDSLSFKKITVGFGLWTLVTVSLALFAACLLAVKLSLFNNVLMGVVTGLVIWGMYFTLLVWISSTTVGSLLGSVFKTATSSFQELVGTATAALGAKSVSNQLAETAESTVAAIRKELSSGLNDETLRDNLKDYLVALRSPQLDTQNLEQVFEQWLQDSGMLAQVDRDTLAQSVNRQSFIDLVQSRTDLSRQETERIAGQLYRIWQKHLDQAGAAQQPIQELMGYLRSAQSEELHSEKMGDRLERLLSRWSRSPVSGQAGQPLSQGFNVLMGILLERADLSDQDLEGIVRRLKSIYRQVMGELGERGVFADRAGVPPQLVGLDAQSDRFSPLREEVANYLRQTYSWQFKGDRLDQSFQNLLYDADADPSAMRRSVEQVDRSYFIEILQSRGVFTQTEIRDISLRLEIIRQQVLNDLIAAERVQVDKHLRRKLETFFKFTPRDELMAPMGLEAFEQLVGDDEATVTQLQERYAPFDYAWMYQFFSANPQLVESEAEKLARQYRLVLDRKLADVSNLQEATKLRLAEQWQSLETHLRHTQKSELNPDGIRRDLKTLLEEPNVGIQRLRFRLAQFDRETLVATLAERPDMSREEAEQLVSEIETSWTQVLQTPQHLKEMAQSAQAAAQEQYEQATQAIAQYLRNTGKAELNPDGISRDLQQLLDDPKAGLTALRDRLSHMDRDTLVQLLSQRDDLSEAEVQSAIDHFQSAVQNLIKAPRRLARRAQVELYSFEQALADYLRNTGKAELNPTGIKRDLEMLVQDPRLGADLIGNRLSRMDRSTLTALLAQRNDLSPEEAEAIVNRLLSVRDQIQSQFNAVQRQLKAWVDTLLARVRDYLNALERPELNYEGIRRDVGQLFDDPQAGFGALRDRLSQFDRDTLIAVLSSHDSISQTDAERVALQIEQARDGVLRRAEQIEHQLEGRLSDLKQQAQARFEETQRAAEAAAWWMFATALLSAISSAIAGGLAVAG